MRIWSLHPQYLDRQGLTACWRETLLAQAVLAGRTRGYRNHPQVDRFRAQPTPLVVVGSYLTGIAAEAASRGYNFDSARILEAHGLPETLPVTQGQFDFEWAHLLCKLEVRTPHLHDQLSTLVMREPHPLFHVVPGPIEAWERP